MEAEIISTPSQLASMMFRFLRRMDAEATTKVGNDYHAGLVNYATHLGIRKEDDYEDSWNDRLKELLCEAGFSARREIPYPSESTRCDIVADLPHLGRIWVETKSAWKTWFSSYGKVKKNPANFRSYLNGTKSHTLVKDLKKLSTLTSQDAQYIAELLIGFDSIHDPMTEDVEVVIEQEGWLSDGLHVFGPEIWSDRNCQACRFNCWFFCRSLCD